MLNGKIVNIIRIIGKKQESIDKILDYISSENRVIDYNKIIPLFDVSDEEEQISKWGEPLNSQIDAFKIDKKELLIKVRTLVNPPLKIIKHLSLFSEIDEVILSFANLDMISESGLFYIRRGGVMQKNIF